MTNTIPAGRRPALIFLAIAAIVYVGNYAIVQWAPLAGAASVPEWPLAVDFFIMLPVLGFMLLRPSFKRGLLLFIGLFSFGVLIGSFLIPAEDKFLWKHLEQLRWLCLIMVLVAQFSVIALAATEIYRNRHASNMETAIERVLAERFGPAQLQRWLLAEARVWSYALVRSPSQFQFPPGAFYCARHDSNASNQQAFLWLIAAEIPVAHILIHAFSPTWALVITALSIYGLIFLWAEYRATMLRATTLQEALVHIRHGVLGDVTVRYQDICAVLPTSGRPRRAKRSLRFVGTATANVKLCLRPGTQLETLIGPREVDCVYLGLDEPRRFMAELQGKIGVAHLVPAQ